MSIGEPEHLFALSGDQRHHNLPFHTRFPHDALATEALPIRFNVLLDNGAAYSIQCAS